MIFPKPFKKSEMLRRTIFKGRPNFFNAIDLNKELMILHNYMEEFNNRIAIVSNVKFTVSNFSEILDNATNKWTRRVSINWLEGIIKYNGVEFQISAGGMSSDFVQIYDNPNTTISPKQVKPPSYLCLTGELVTVSYGDNPILCGLQADEIPNSVPTVDVEQYKNLTFKMTDNPDTLENNIAIIAVIHPRHKEDGSADGFGFLNYTLDNPDFRMKNGNGNTDGVFKNNKTLFEYVIERISGRLDFLLNERQLIRRFNLADIADFFKARNNIGFSKLVNHRQLVQAENLKDLPDPEKARFNLGLGSSATRNIGSKLTDVAPGNIVPIGAIIMWYGPISSIPAGWVFCDGTNGTPDMRKKFPVGFDSTSNEYLLGQTGGEEKVKLTGAQSGLQAHGHPVTDNGHSHGLSPDAGRQQVAKSGSGNALRTENYPTSARTTHDKANITVGDTTSKDATEAHENRPPYIALGFIMYRGIETIPVPTPTQETLSYPNFSTPTNVTDDGYSTYVPVTVGSSGGVNMGSGIILTNPE